MAIISPVDYGPEVSYCGICGHFHNGDCEYSAGEACDSYLCCISAGSDDNCSGCGAEIALDCVCD